MDIPVLEVRNIKKTFKKGKYTVTAVDGISFKMMPGEVLGLVGESGSGKSTIAKLITHLQSIDEGQIIFNGEDISHVSRKKMISIYKEMQMVFQDPVGSFDPRMKIGDSIREVLCRLCYSQGKLDKIKVEEVVETLLNQVGLKPEYAERYPYELSGGQCQRAAIARAIAVHPKLLICDEVTSALDVSAQAQIVELLISLGKQLDMAILFISHDLSLVSCICDKVCVLYKGEQVEYRETKKVIRTPDHPYTKKLLSSALYMDKMNV
ncbi:ABC transporter related [Alkaliphilus metalliredigens QYMF]|uniref:ABC transporter related n=1 Tax=Alkaliphilus metalliredigens (strain QYMF) TaxID=293826 RepID=A6TMB4_ALKMQ|nr:ABC transporter ATP-binding protein [Alkaliphilus metalliredigens]ABR47332.1 ABC transporter related [Alkaliphilus metalliredigens QYMF]